jgi:hypothetical protein
MAWTFSGVFLDGVVAGRMTVGTGAPEELPGRYALGGLVDAHAHPTVAADEDGPYLADGEYGAARLDEYAAAGSLARDFLGVHPQGDIVTYGADPRDDPSVLAAPAAVVVRGVRVR